MAYVVMVYVVMAYVVMAYVVMAAVYTSSNGGITRLPTALLISVPPTHLPSAASCSGTVVLTAPSGSISDGVGRYRTVDPGLQQTLVVIADLPLSSLPTLSAVARCSGCAVAVPWLARVHIHVCTACGIEYSADGRAPAGRCQRPHLFTDTIHIRTTQRYRLNT